MPQQPAHAPRARLLSWLRPSDGPRQGWLHAQLVRAILLPARLGQPLAPAGFVAQGPLLGFAALVLVLCALRQGAAGAWLLLDNDLGWHLSYGHALLDSLSLPGPDTWSWTAFGQTYQLTQAGGELLLAAAESVGGATGIVMLMSGCLALTVTLAFAACCVAGARPLLAAGVTLAVLLPLWAGTARPAAFGWLLLAWLVLHLARLLRSGLRADALACAGICTVWTSVHGSFPIGLLLLLCVFPVAALQYSARSRVPEAPLEPQQGLASPAVLAVCGAGALLGSLLLNPYGPDAWRAVWTVSQLETTRQAYFADWRPVHLLSGMGVSAWWALLALLVLARRPGTTWPLLLACLAVALLGVSAQRGVALAAILAAPLLARALAHAPAPEPEPTPSRPPTRRAWPGWLPAAAALAGAILLSLQRVSPQEVETAEAAIYPVRTAGALVAAAPGRRLLCEAEQGGWWIRRYPQMLVSLDGRADLHPDQAYWRHERILQLRPGWQRDLQEMDPDAVSVRRASPLAGELLQARGWRLVAQDGLYLAFVRSRDHAR